MRRKLAWLTIAVGAGLFVAMWVRGAGVTARRRPSDLEARAAKAAWRFLVPASARSATNPVASSAEALRAGLEHWADHCAICHGNDGSGDTTVGRNLHPRAPDMRAAATQSLTDGELFYVIEQGIPFTGMPAWSTGTPEGERSSWELVTFIRHLPKLAPAEIEEMERLNPRSPAEEAREKAIDDFLNPKLEKPTPGKGRGRGSSAPDVRLLRLPPGGIQPQIAVDAGGVVHLLYFKGEAGSGDLFYSTVGDDEALSAPLRVNSQPGSAIATGNVRGGRLAAGRSGRVHIVWNGSDRAAPRAPGSATPMLYTRMNAARTAFEPQRNLLQFAVGLDGGGAVTADRAGRVHVFWHAGGPASKDETTRRVWVAASSDDGSTFARERAISAIETGACGCCGVGALAGSRGLFVLYRAARELTHRDTYLLTSRDAGRTFTSSQVEPWEIGACPMSTYALAEGPAGVLAAWETEGQVRFAHVDQKTGAMGAATEAPGAARTRKHPVIATNSRADILFVWTEAMGWQRGGGVAWQLYDANGRPSHGGRAEGVPAWSLVAAYARKDGGFTIVY